MQRSDDRFILKLGIGIPVLAFAVFLVYWFYFRDAWEIENYAIILEKVDNVQRAIAESNDGDAAQLYQEFLQLIGDRRIQDPFLYDRVQETMAAFVAVEARLLAAEQETNADEQQHASAHSPSQQLVEETAPSEIAQPVRTVALSGSVAPGIEDSSAPKFFARFRPPVLNDFGQIAFRGFLTHSLADNPDTAIEGIWSEGRGRGLELVAYELNLGNPPPGTIKGTWYVAFGDPVISDTGETSFVGYLFSPDVDDSKNCGIWLYASDGDLRLVARSGTQAPGVAAGVNFSNLYTPVMSDAGQIAFLADLDSHDPASGIWSSRDNDRLSLIVFSEDQAGNVDEGATFLTIGGIVLNNAGQIAFRGDLSFEKMLQSIKESKLSEAELQKSVDRELWNSKNSVGIWSIRRPQGLGLVVRSGDRAPGTGDGVKFSGFDAPTINSRGQIAFRGNITGNQVNDSNDRGIWVEGLKTGLRLVARTGDHTPTTDERVFFSDFETVDYHEGFNLALNGDGQIAFVARLAGKGVNRFNDLSICSQLDGDDLTLIARSGSHAPSCDDYVQFSGFRFIVMNGNGQVAFLGGLIGPGVDESNNWGLWAQDTSGNLTLIAREGDRFDFDTGSGSDQRTIRSLAFVGGTGNESGLPSAFNDAGQLAFLTEFTDGSSGIFVSNKVANSGTVGRQ